VRAHLPAGVLEVRCLRMHSHRLASNIPDKIMRPFWQNGGVWRATKCRCAKTVQQRQRSVAKLSSSGQKLTSASLIKKRRNVKQTAVASTGSNMCSVPDIHQSSVPINGQTSKKRLRKNTVYACLNVLAGVKHIDEMSACRVALAYCIG